MPLYAYTAMNAEGRSHRGEAEAASPQTLAASLASRGLILAAPAKNLDRRLLASRKALPTRMVTRFLNELALMLGSGLPLDDALGLGREGAPPPLARVIDALRGELHGGASAAEAFERQGAALGDEIGPLIRVAEQTGDFASVLRALAAQRQRAQAMSDKVVGALRYPAFLFIAALTVGCFFLLHVIPQFSGLIRDSGNDPGPFVRGLFALSDGLVANQSTLGLALGLVLALGLAAGRSARTRELVARALLRLPLVQGTWRLWQATQALTQLGLLLSQGVGLTKALTVLEGVIGPDKSEALRRASDSIRRGERLAAAFAAEEVVPPLALRMLAIGEGTGELAKVAQEAGQLYAQKLEQRLDAFAQVVGPAAIVVIALLIGGLMVSIMAALTSVNQSIL